MANNKRATLFDPTTGQREAIDIGSTREKELFSQGFQLETKPAASLEGTLEAKTPAPKATLGEFRSVMDQIRERTLTEVAKRKPVALDFLEKFSGKDPLSAPIIRQALQSEFKRIGTGVETRFRGLIDIYGAQIEEDRRKREEFLGIAFSEGVLRSGTTPSQLPQEYKDLWNLASKGVITGENKLDSDQKIELMTDNSNGVELIRALESGNLYQEITIPDITQPNGQPQRAKRNNSPVNLKVGGLTQKWVDDGVATLDPEPATDGGNYLRFADPNDGVRAGKDLLFNTDFYGNRTFDDAMKTWSNNGYGAEVAPNIDPEKLMKDMDSSEQNRIFPAMANRESGTKMGAIRPIPREGAVNDFEKGILTARIGKSIYGTRISDAESKRVEGFIQAGTAQGKSPTEIIDLVLGYDVLQNKELGETLKQTLLQFGDENGLSGFDMLGLSRLLNADNRVGAVNKVEKAVLTKVPDAIETESVAVFGQQKGDEIIGNIEDNLDKLGIAAGTYNKFRKKFVADKNFQSLESDITGFVSEWRHTMAGANFTEIEQKVLEPLVADVRDNPFNAIEKIKSLQRLHLSKNNSIRTTHNLPTLNPETLLDKNARVGLYEEGLVELPETGVTNDADLSDLDFSF